jgi:topoisomerase IV subunit A
MSKALNIHEIKFDDALEQRYLAYALSTIMSRSLPDVRDGLKPVHRRVLYAMLQLKLDPKTGYKKCARIVGDVTGKYHPHGGEAVYDALVRMAQTFSSRYPTVDGQGNFGSVDGDNQAAMRYTEARLTPYATYLLQDIEQDTVDFRPNYDGQEDEPVVLPSYVPNILANGTEGIAVGMATSIPPHNIIELLDAVLLLLKKPKSSIAELQGYIKAPDFPTGGILVEPKESILKSYETGRGSFRLRARWHKEELERGQYRIIITEIPYQVQKKGLIEKLAELYTAKKLPFLETFSDNSAEDIKMILVPKSRNIAPEVIMEHLFKYTDLEVKVQLNLNVLDLRSVPRVMNIKEVLDAFIAHRIDVTSRRLRYRLGNVIHRLEILQGLLIIFLHLDEVIRIIREEDEPKEIIMKKWKLTDLQAESILNTRLRSLRKLEELHLKKEFDELTLEKKQLEETLADEKKLKEVVVLETKKIKQVFEKLPIGKRKTSLEVAAEVEDIALDTFVEKEPLTIIYSEMGWLRAQKGHKLENIRYKEGDAARFIIECMSTDKVIFFSNCGKSFALNVDKISRGKGDGDPIRLTFDLHQDEHITAMFKYNPEDKFLISSQDGRGFVVEGKDVLAQTKAGKQVMTCEEFTALNCQQVNGNWVLSVGENRRLLVFKISEIPTLRKGRGVVLQKLKQGKLLAIKVLQDDSEFSTLVSGTVKDMKMWIGKRGGLGRLVLGKLWID